jgi:hypothetical protein
VRAAASLFALTAQPALNFMHSSIAVMPVIFITVESQQGRDQNRNDNNNCGPHMSPLVLILITSPVHLYSGSSASAFQRRGDTQEPRLLQFLDTAIFSCPLVSHELNADTSRRQPASLAVTYRSETRVVGEPFLTAY